MFLLVINVDDLQIRMTFYALLIKNKHGKMCKIFSSKYFISNKQSAGKIVIPRYGKQCLCTKNHGHKGGCYTHHLRPITTTTESDYEQIKKYPQNLYKEQNRHEITITFQEIHSSCYQTL